MGGGTIFKAVTKEDMYGLAMLVPSTLLVARFDRFAGPLFRDLEILTKKNANLRRTRDLLLPRLISGEPDVTGLDIAVPAPPV
jgi:type I restriction enzyme S subunit